MMSFRVRTSAALLALSLSSPLRASEPLAAAALSTRLDQVEAAMIGNPRWVADAAARARTDAISIVDLQARQRIIGRARWLEGEALGRLGDIVAAERTLDEAAKLVAASDPRGLLHARIILSQGATAFDKGEVQTAFRRFRNAFAMFQAIGDTRGQALALQSIGTIYIDAGDYERVLRYYAQSAEIHPGDDKLTLSASNNQALALKELGRLREAEQSYRRALDLATKLGSAASKARILTNIASVQLAGGDTKAADATVTKGLSLARGDGAEWAPYLWGVRLQAAMARKDAAVAVALIPRVFAGVDLKTTTYLYRDFHQSAADAEIAAGNPAASVAHLRAVNRLDAEARDIRSSANAALLAAQFDSANQELRIARRDVALAASRARTQLIMLGASVVLLLASLAAFIWVTRSRNETRRVNVRLNKALAAKSEFLATTSHEIRTPLNGIMGMTQVLLHSKEMMPAVRERVAIIDGASKAMKAIVDDLLDMAKIEAGEVSVERDRLDLHKLLRETAALWSADAAAKGIEIRVDVSAAPATIIEDERKLRQILVNLVSNAVKFTASGHITVGAAQSGDRLLASVADTGIGVPPDQLEAIFESFHQVDGATTRQHSGTGLGLAISRQLAQALGGTVTVESVIGEGSRFIIDLPLQAVSDVAGRAPDAKSVSFADAHVLLADANPLFQSIVRASLEDVVGHVECAESIDEALVAGRFDVVVVDRAMLGEMSIEAVRNATGAGAVLTLVAPGAATGDAPDLVEKAIPPIGLVAAIEKALGNKPDLKVAC